MTAVPLDPLYIAVVGGGEADHETCDVARQVGRELARRKVTVLCGGLGGVMEAACQGAKAEGGITVALLPGDDRRAANRFVDVAIPTGMGEARNALVARAADGLIAVGGEFGTLSEIALGLRMAKPVVGLYTWELSRGGRRVDAVVAVDSPLEAVERVVALATHPARRGWLALPPRP